MRRTGRTALALLGLALLAHACGKDIEREPPAGDYHGQWRGTTAESGPARFQVAADQVTDFVFQDPEGVCIWLFTRFEKEEIPIEGNRFDEVSDENGHVEVHGEFLSDDLCVVRYSYRALPRENRECPRDGDGSFQATKVR